jgi:hypothetical protein
MVFDENEMILNRKNNYEWNGYHNYKVDANIVGGIIECIERQNGSVTSEALLEVAKSEDSPIHNMFEWNDKVAANKYRLEQSRVIICSLRVVVTADNEDEPEKKISAFVNVNPPSEVGTKSVYMNLNNALSNEDTRKNVLDRMYRDMQAFIDRYYTFDEATKVIQAMSEALDKG